MPLHHGYCWKVSWSYLKKIPEHVSRNWMGGVKSGGYKLAFPNVVTIVVGTLSADDNLELIMFDNQQ
jgi:hypothetical protein